MTKTLDKPLHFENATTTKALRLMRCVVSQDKMQKSRVATATRRVRHPLLGKYMKRTTKIMFHDEENQSRVGDEVLVCATRPLSARKSFALHSIVQKKSR